MEESKLNPEVLVSKGHLLKTFGDVNSSIKSYKSSYEIDKYYGDAYWSLANLKTYEFTDNEILQLEKMTNDEYVNENEKFKEGAGVKASATRARKALMEISKLCKTRRGEIQEAKNNA